MALSELQPRTRVARIAPFVPAIQAARGRGVSWSQITEEIGPALGIAPGRGAADAVRAAYRAAVRQIERGRLTTPPAAPVRPPVQTAARPAAGYLLPGQKPSRPATSEMDEIRAEFDD